MQIEYVVIAVSGNCKFENGQLDERCIITVVRFADWLVVYIVRILRGLFSCVNLSMNKEFFI